MGIRRGQLRVPHRPLRTYICYVSVSTLRTNVDPPRPSPVSPHGRRTDGRCEMDGLQLQRDPLVKLQQSYNEDTLLFIKFLKLIKTFMLENTYKLPSF